MTDANRTPVTVLGLGLMGRALAEALLRAGHPTTVWNRTAGKAEGLTGARVAATAEEAAAASPLVLVCVSDHDAVQSLLGSLAGRDLVNFTSSTSAQARETAARHGGRYLDGAIMAVPPAIGTAGAILVYSGPRDVFDRYEPALRSLGDTVYLGADHGLSGLNEVAVSGLMWSMLDGFLHGAALLGTAGLPATAFAPLAGTAVAMVAGWFDGYARQVDEGAYPALDATIDTHRAAMANLVSESQAHGVDASLPRLVQALAERAAADGHGGDSYAAMIETFRQPSGATA